MFAFGKPNFRLFGQKLFLDFKNPYKIIAFAEPERSEGEATIAENPNSEKWRREGDSNPRESCWPPNRFRVDPVTTTSVSLRYFLQNVRSDCFTDAGADVTLF